MNGAHEALPQELRGALQGFNGAAWLRQGGGRDGARVQETRQRGAAGPPRQAPTMGRHARAESRREPAKYDRVRAGDADRLPKLTADLASRRP
jgi:hypothetical protein